MSESPWQPIETAPKDGTEVLIVAVFEGDESPVYAVACNDGEGLGWRDTGDIGWGGMCYVEPTHWMPLPQSPPAEEGKP